MSHAEKIIEVKAKSTMRFQEILGKPISYEEAVRLATKEYEESLQDAQNEVWVDITTGKRIQGQY